MRTADFDDPAEPAWDWVARHVRDYVATDGAHPRRGHDWLRGSTVLLLTTLGRQSGKARRTALIYGRDGDNYLVVASKGGSDRAPTWYLNLLADPRVRVQVKGEILHGRARVATEQERGRLWAVMTKVWPDYDEYQAKTSRRIPVVVIEPAVDGQP